MQRTQAILIPVAPSAIDIHATANFIKELLLIGQVRFRHIRVAVVANRVRNARPVYEPLERFVSSLGIAFLTRVSDSDVYVDAAEKGLGIYDLPPEQCATELREFQPIVQWVSGDSSPAETEGAAPSNVIQLNVARA
jgi:chromosome partitioning protein